MKEKLSVPKIDEREKDEIKIMCDFVRWWAYVVGVIVCVWVVEQDYVCSAYVHEYVSDHLNVCH